MTINSFNTFDNIKEIMLGDVDHTVIDFCDADQRLRLNHIFNKTKKELNQIQKILESRDIKVHRPVTIGKTQVRTPYWSSMGTKIPLTPRDVFLIMGNDIVESAHWQKERMFETYHWRDLFISKLESGARWHNMPLPRHDYASLEVEFDDIVVEQDPILDGAAILRYGKDIFISGDGSHNELGRKWLQAMFPDRRYHQLDKNVFNGHLDSHLTILRPGLLLTYHIKENLPEYFKNWDIIHVNPEHDKSLSLPQTLVDYKIQDDDFANTVLAVNTLSLGPNTVMMYSHYKNNQYLLDQFNKHQIEIIFVDFTYSHFFNQGMTCLTNELNRDTDGCIDYLG